MLRQSLRTHRRKGPLYRFQIPLDDPDRVLQGTASRYAVRIVADFPLTEPEQGTIRSFLRSLTLGTPELREG